MSDNVSSYPVATRPCLGCGQHLQLEQFPPNGGGKLRPRCRDCNNTQKREHYQAYRDKILLARYHRAYYLQHKFGMTLDDYETLLEAQAGGCAICGTTTPDGRNGRFHVDHDHNTGQIRGLLCHSCNTGIGKLRDDPVILLKAADYLIGGGRHR